MLGGSYHHVYRVCNYFQATLNLVIPAFNYVENKVKLSPIREAENMVLVSSNDQIHSRAIGPVAEPFWKMLLISLERTIVRNILLLVYQQERSLRGSRLTCCYEEEFAYLARNFEQNGTQKSTALQGFVTRASTAGNAT